MPKSLLIAVFLCFFYFDLWPQVTRRDTSKVIIQKFDSLITTRASFNNYIEYFQTNIFNKTVDILPNTNMKISFAAAYRFLYAGFSISPDWLPANGDDDLRGKTKFVNYGFGINLDHFIQHFNFSYTRGYFLKNQGRYYKLPNTIHRVYSGYTGFKINKNYSVAAISTMAERQNKSAGSLIPYCSTNITLLMIRKK